MTPPDPQTQRVINLILELRALGVICQECALALTLLFEIEPQHPSKRPRKTKMRPEPLPVENNGFLPLSYFTKYLN